MTAFFAEDGSPRYAVEREADGRWMHEGPPRRLPEGITLRTTGPAEKVFNPNGTCSFGSVILEGPDGVVCRLSLNPATGRVRLYRNGKERGGDR